MRRRLLVVLCAVPLALSAPVGHAYAPNNCYMNNAYVVSTFVNAAYVDNTCAPGDPPAPVTDSNERKNLFRFPGMWN